MKRKDMRQKNTPIKIGIISLILLAGLSHSEGQTILYEEDMGIPYMNTLIQYYDGWQDTTVLYVGNGTCDVRTSGASTGYGGASGGGNVLINDTVKWFQISGLNTTSPHPTVRLYCGLRKTVSENGSSFAVEFSTDSIVWVRLPMEDTLPTGTGTSGWYRVCFPNVPANSHLHLRFSSLAKVEYRLDDIRIVDGEETILETVATPVCSPSGGTYYEPQQVALTCETPGATIHYTLDGSVPDTSSAVCTGTLFIDTICTLKALASHDSMYNSSVVVANFIILDTSSLVALPFDITGNSDSTHADIKFLAGFRSNKLGTSYANGSAKFESKNAGSAMLIAHLDGPPGTVSFDLRGMKSGTPPAYNGITFLLSESADGIQWTTVTTLNESDISSEEFSHFGELPLSAETRYLRWLLAAAANGNTQLNNISISRRQEDSDDSGISERENVIATPYPNPASTSFRWAICGEATLIRLYDKTGRVVRQWENVSGNDDLNISGVSAGLYILQAKTDVGTTTKKLIIK